MLCRYVSPYRAFCFPLSLSVDSVLCELNKYISNKWYILFCSPRVPVTGFYGLGLSCMAETVVVFATLGCHGWDY